VSGGGGLGAGWRAWWPPVDGASPTRLAPKRQAASRKMQDARCKLPGRALCPLHLPLQGPCAPAPCTPLLRLLIPGTRANRGWDSSCCLALPPASLPTYYLILLPTAYYCLAPSSSPRPAVRGPRDRDLFEMVGGSSALIGSGSGSRASAACFEKK
jgi:hypothetical protein